ncbi:ABC transporter ATP-binding protein [Legionella beliardensis]|uniref:ABC transporter ATP-binding protein n=1 Tax=Legionella beliardensis TaxID=91822 RepID=A0A378I211_9GAMM|nr:ABC transporter ATP-binding protein [Legionella beliardensis]STX28741.1 ABC transporter ATP-binding protein [Legionella beliardensis]
MEKTNLIIDANNLYKSFSNVPTIKNVSIKVEYGEIFGFLGPNGSGKTTIIRMLCGLLTPDAGSGTFMNYDILTEINAIKKHIGYVPQFFSLYKQLTVYQNILLTAELYSVPHRYERVEQVIQQLGLSSVRNQLSGTLSGGWKQRLALAAAIVHEPLLLLLDEPTANVDPESSQRFWRLMHHLSSEGMTILLSSHNMNEVQHCNQIAYICEGQVIVQGKINEIIKHLNLTTWEVQGPNIINLAKELEVIPGIEQINVYFNRLHISGKDSHALAQAINPYMKDPQLVWTKITPELEDAFIWLAKY